MAETTTIRAELSPAPALARFTNTHLAWAGILLMALFVRAALPGAFTLSNAEAVPALTAFSAASGERVMFGNPFFGWLQSLGFAVFGAAETSARLWSILAGATLCILPSFLPAARFSRARLFVMGLLLALSPTLWFISRQATGVALAWALAFAGWALWQRNAQRAAFIAFGLLLACGADALLPALSVALVSLAGLLQITKTDSQLSINLAPHTHPSAKDALWALAAFVLASSGIFMRLSGPAEALNGLATALQPALGALALNRAALGFVIYEPLIWLFALAAPLVLVATKTSARAHLSEIAWVIVGLIALLFAPVFGVSAVIPLVIGCVMLASFALAVLADGLVTRGMFWRDGVVACVLLVMLLVADMGLRNYAGMGQPLWMISGLLGLAMTILAGIAFGLLFDIGAALRGGAIALLVFLGLYTAASALHLNHLKAGNPAEPYVSEGIPDGVNTLVSELNTLSIRAYTDPGAIPMQVADTASPALRWALRSQRKLTYTAKPQNAEALLLPQNTKPETSAEFSGSAFVLSQTSDLSSAKCAQIVNQLNCQPLAKWLVFRELPSSNSQRWVLWVRQDLANKAAGKP